jgi:hypothetical protein
MLRQDCAPGTRTLAPALPSMAISVTPTPRSRTLRRAAQALVAVLAVAAWLVPAAVARGGAEVVGGTSEQADLVAARGADPVNDVNAANRVDSDTTAVSTYAQEVADLDVLPLETSITSPEGSGTAPPVAPNEPENGGSVTIDVTPIPDSGKDDAPRAPTAIDAARAGAVEHSSATPPRAPGDKPTPARTSRAASKPAPRRSPASVLEAGRNAVRTPAAVSARDEHPELRSPVVHTQPPEDSQNSAPSLPSLPERSPDSPGAPLGTGAAFGAIGGGAGGGLVVAILLSLFLFTVPVGLRKVRLPDVVLVAPLLARACARPG